MNPGITLITPTGGRPESFARCVGYVNRFVKPEGVAVQWIIVNDSLLSGYMGTVDRSPDMPDIDAILVRPAHRWTPSKNTIALNLLAAIPHIKHDYILFVEDDDVYLPEYLKSMYEAMQTVDIVGEIPARYYHVPSRQYNVQGNRQHASLCQTGIHKSLLSHLEEICKTQSTSFIDVRLWRHPRISPSSKKFLETGYCVGMKGLPGRAGIGIGHRPERNPQSWSPDPDLVVLKSWIHTDVSLYYQ